MMSDYITTCVCGHEREIAAHLVGQALFCPGCRHTLIVTEDSLRRAGQASEDNGVAPGQHPVSPAAAPFASDGGETLPVHPAAAQFAAEEEEEPPEPEPEPESAARFAPADDEDIAIALIAPGGENRPSEPHCERCRTPFRGAWDRYETDEGTLCHRCANLAVERPAQQAVPDPTPALTAAQRSELARLAAENQVRMEEERERASERAAAESSPSFSETYKDEISRVVLVLGILVIVLAVSVALFDQSGPPQETEQAVRAALEEGQSIEELVPLWIKRVVLVLIFVIQFAGEFCALFFVLHWMNKLPSDTLGANLIAVGVVSLGITVFWSLPFHMVPVPILVILAMLGRLFLILYFVYSLYQLTLGELFMYIIGHGLVSIATRAAAVIIFGLIGMMLF